MKKILFVCTGNTCRSPMAAAIFAGFNPAFKVSSAGIFADGSEYCEHSIEAMREIGLDISGGCSRLLSLEDLGADRIFCMSDSHRRMLLSLGADDDKITVLDVPDPFGGTLDDYRRCRDDIYVKLKKYKIGLREFKPCDADAVADIEKQCFSTPWSRDAILESFAANTVFFVAENSSGLVGYAGLSHAADQGYVTNIAVLPEFRRLEIGTRLTERLLQFGRDNSLAFVSLEVRQSNNAAVSTYSKLGFEQKGIRKGFYDNPKEDAIIMTKVIKSEDSCD